MPSRQRHLSLCAFTVFLSVPCLTPQVHADKLQITSTPPGATVELDGVPEGITPFEKEVPGGFFHRTRTVVGARLEHPLVARLSLDGYATREVLLTQGPMNWRSLNGRDHGEYWLLKAKAFHVELKSIAETFTGDITAKLGGQGTVDLSPELSLEEVVKLAKPAVVYLKGFQKAGTGFLVTDTGIIATNAHVARGEETLLALFPDGQQLEAAVVSIDADLDIALVKVEGKNFPHLALADATTLRQGENVLAIGNPGDAMLFSVTKGIVSAVGKFKDAGPGTWVQTDAPINSGNSGGPLLNTKGEVVGINTLKLVKKNTTGIGFALSSTDLLEVLHQYYPKTSPQFIEQSSPLRTEDSTRLAEQSSEIGTVIFVQPEGAEIRVDSEFVGHIPATLKLHSGIRIVQIKAKGHAIWVKRLNVLGNSTVTINPSEWFDEK